MQVTRWSKLKPNALIGSSFVAVKKLRPCFLKCWKRRGSPTFSLKRIGTLNDMLKSSYIIVATQNMNGTPLFVKPGVYECRVVLILSDRQIWSARSAPCPGAVPIFAERCHGVEVCWLWLNAAETWRAMEHDGRWWKMMEDDGRWWKMMEDDGRWWKMMEDDGRWWKMMEDVSTFGPLVGQMLLNIPYMEHHGWFSEAAE